MATQGEYDYFKNIGAAGMRHAKHKPWSDEQCGLYLMELGAMMGLMPQGGRLLDMGCGTGWTSVLFAKRGYDVVGAELVPEAVEEEYGVTERDMHPAKIIRAGRRVGFRGFSVHPHASYLYIALYRKDLRGAVGKLLRFPGMRLLVGIATLLFSKHQAGITVLRK